uniref:Lipocalin/cytosolic fatty-acid binding domain-containing protein n=1 Tax=Vombatus ursinus TaxID=29139 RepID=A0A4X2M4C5_VOMUR
MSPFLPVTREEGVGCQAEIGIQILEKPESSGGESCQAGVGMALRKMAGMAKPDVYISENGDVITIKTESTIKTTQFSFKLGEKFDETTADGRKTQTLCTLDNDTLIQLQAWDGKESTITRKVEDGKLLVDCVMNNVTCHRVYEKAE